MNIVFLGSSEFAVPSLKALSAAKHNISCVITQPDRLSGRGLHSTSTPVKILAKKIGLKIYQPENINASASINFLKNLRPDLFIVIAYGQILSAGVLDIPKLFTINIHASLLPKYRGAAPINWAIINGDRLTGITAIQVNEKMDAGPIILQKELPIKDSDNSITLEEKLSHLGASLLMDVVDSIKSKKYKLTPQEEEKKSLAKKLQKKDGLINWQDSAHDIYNLIRGCVNWPGAFTYYRGKLLKVYRAEISPSDNRSQVQAGQILNVSKDGLSVKAGSGSLTIKELQIEGKRRLIAQDFIAGHKISVGESFDKK